MSMRTDLSDHLTVQQWLSPAFPIGAFAYSHGVEWAIDTGRIIDGDTLYDWIVDLIHHGSLRTDAILLALASTGGDAYLLHDTAVALCPSSERVSETMLQGTAFGRVICDVWGQAAGDIALPVAVGRAAYAQGIAADLVVSAYAHAFCCNVISVAVRLVPLGQTAGQRVLHRLTPAIVDLTHMACGATTDDLGSVTYLSDVAAMRHETQQPRIFKT